MEVDVQQPRHPPENYKNRWAFPCHQPGRPAKELPGDGPAAGPRPRENASRKRVCFCGAGPQTARVVFQRQRAVEKRRAAGGRAQAIA